MLREICERCWTLLKRQAVSLASPPRQRSILYCPGQECVCEYLAAMIQDMIQGREFNCGGSAFCFWHNESLCDIFSDKPPCSSFEALLSRSITQKLHAVWVLKVSGFLQWASSEEPASKVCWCLLTCVVCFLRCPWLNLEFWWILHTWFQTCVWFCKVFFSDKFFFV